MIVAVNKDEITADVAARLVAAQFPQWAGLPVTPVTLNGQDNTTFRLGDELSLRLPSASCVPQVAKEHRCCRSRLPVRRLRCCAPLSSCGGSAWTGPGRCGRCGCCPGCRRAGSGAALFRVPEGRRKAMLVRDIGYALAGLTAAGIIFIGARFLLAPSPAAAGFGIAAWHDGGKADPYLSVKGVPDIASWLIAVILLAAGMPHVMGWFEVAASTIPNGDAIIMLRSYGPKATSTACRARRP